MKKKLILVFLLITIPVLLCPKSNSREKKIFFTFYFGTTLPLDGSVQTYFENSNWKIKESNGLFNNVGLSLGLGLSFNLYSYLYVNSGLYYTEKKSGYKISEEVYDYYNNKYDTLDLATYTFNMNFLQIPIILRFGEHIFIGAGAYIGILTEKPSWQDGGSDNNISGIIDKTYFKRINAGLIFEFGFSYKIIEYNIRVEYGLTPIIDTKVEKIKNFSLTGMIGIRFNTSSLF